MIDTSDWLIAEINHYRLHKGREPVFLSDWDCDPHDGSVIEDIVIPSLIPSASQLSRYSYAEDQSDARDCFLTFLKSNSDLSLTLGNVSISLNATNALYLCLCGLQASGVQRFLVITPVYYSVLESLGSMKASVVFHHLRDDDQFALDLDAITDALESQCIEALLFTDPIYSAGIDIPSETYEALAGICHRLGVWLICDHSLGGLYWDERPASLFDFAKLKALQRVERFIYIDSLTKRLFLNGVKHAVILAPDSFILLVHDLASRISGGFCSSQISVFRALHETHNTLKLVKFIERNRARVISHYKLMAAALTGTDYALYPSNAGYFSMICHKEHRIKDVDTKQIVRRLLYEHDLYVLPSEHFYFFKQNHFGIRANLINDVSSSLPRLVEAISQDADLLDQSR